MSAGEESLDVVQQEVPDEAPPRLELASVRYRGSGETSIRLNGFSDVVRAGEMVRVELHRRNDPRETASMMLGLNAPVAGEIRFDGDDWLGKDYARHFKMRSRVGRVFAGAAWIQSLTIGDNIRLAMSHHRVSNREIRKSVKQWAERIAGRKYRLVRRALKMRPSFVEPSMLQVCQLIRAFCCRPSLLLLERPLRHASSDLIQVFAECVDDLRDEGAAVVWFAGDGLPEIHFRRPHRPWQLRQNELIASGPNQTGEATR